MKTLTILVLLGLLVAAFAQSSGESTGEATGEASGESTGATGGFGESDYMQTKSLQKSDIPDGKTFPGFPIDFKINKGDTNTVTKEIILRKTDFVWNPTNSMLRVEVCYVAEHTVLSRFDGANPQGKEDDGLLGQCEYYERAMPTMAEYAAAGGFDANPSPVMTVSITLTACKCANNVDFQVRAIVKDNSRTTYPALIVGANTQKYKLPANTFAPFRFNFDQSKANFFVSCGALETVQVFINTDNKVDTVDSATDSNTYPFPAKKESELDKGSLCTGDAMAYIKGVDPTKECHLSVKAVSKDADFSIIYRTDDECSSATSTSVLVALAVVIAKYFF